MLDTPESLAKKLAEACMEQEPTLRMQFFTFNNSDGFQIGGDEYIVVTFARKRFVSYPEEKVEAGAAVMG